MSIPLTSPSGTRLVHTVAGAASLVIVVALLWLSLAQASPLLPVTLSLRVGGPGEFAKVDLAAAAAIVMLVAAVARILFGVTATRATSPSVVGVRMLELSQTTAITVFLVAQLNGVTEAGTLILIYAIAAGAVGILWMHSRTLGDQQRSAWPYSLGAAIAVVPWGIVALYQVVGLLTGVPAPPLVRVLTVVLLLLAAAAWAVERLVHRGALVRARAEAVHITLQLASGIVLLVLAVGLARPSALF